jgi:opacity protein-like surface antigen
MKNILFLFAAAATFASSPAISALEGAYGSVFGGVNWLENYSRSHCWNHQQGQHHKSHHKFKFQTGYLVGGAVGFEWCNNIRGEVEFAYRHNKLKHGSFAWDNKTPVNLVGGERRGHCSGHAALRTWSVLANALYDFDVDCYCIKPYLGFGIGYGNNKVVNHRWNWDQVNNNGKWRNRHRGQNNFAWQFIAGVAYPICDNFDLDIEYRFFQSHKHVRSNDLVFGGKYAF